MEDYYYIIESVKHQILLLSIYIPLLWTFIIAFSNLKKNPARLYLLGLFINVTFVYIMTYFRYYNSFNIYSSLFPIQAFAVASSFPLFYMYVYSITNTRKEHVFIRLYHFILPLFMGIIFWVLMYVFMDGGERLYFMSNYVYNPDNTGAIFKYGYVIYRSGKIIYVLQSVLYLCLFIRLHKKHRENIEDRFATSEGVDLNWLKLIGVLLGLVIIFNAVMHLLKLNIISHYNLLPTISYAFFDFFFMSIGILALRQKEIYGVEAFNYEVINGEKRVYKLTKSEFETHIKNDKPYLNKDYNIYDLCYNFNTNRTYISSFINQRYNINFKTLINSYRINEAKGIIRLSISKEQNLPMEFVAMKAGFNSYSTFLRVFKQMENITPIDFRNDMQS